MKTWQKVVGTAVLVFAGIQFVPVDRSNPVQRSSYAFAAEVQPILKRACFDCHSNETVWPWYSYVAPVAWLVAHDVNEGRSKLNFSEWGAQLTQEQLKRGEEIAEEVNEGEMPMPIYLLIHADAKLSQQDVAVLNAWSGSFAGGQEAEASGSETETHGE